MFVAVEDDLIDHPKTQNLCALLGDDFAWKHLVLLWRWAMKYAKDGNLSRYSTAVIERAMKWTGHESALLKALEEAGFIDYAEDGPHIHGWMEYQGRWVEKLERDRERKRTERANGRPMDVPRKSDGHPTDGAATAQVPDPTRPDQTDPTSGAGGRARSQEQDTASVLRTRFGALWAEKYQRGYCPPGKDAQAIADARAELTSEAFAELPDLVPAYLALTEAWLVERRHPLWAMFSRLNELRAKPARQQPRRQAIPEV